MNNDISRDLNYSNMQKINYNQQINNKNILSEEIIAEKTDDSAISNSMKCLNALGCAQISMTSRRVEKSCEEFLKNPKKVKAYIDFSDNLVQNGYKLEDAIAITDCVFKDIK